MSKIKDKNLTIGIDDNISFIDQYNNYRIVKWDDNIEKYLFEDGGIQADNYVNATNSHIENRPPLPSDNNYIIPTIWIDSDTLKYYILRQITSGNADWQEMASGIIQAEDPRLTINDGSVEPTSPNPYDMWVILE